MSMNPRETTERIRNDYQEYVESILNVRDTKISELAKEKVRKTEFVKGPYLEITLPFEKGHSLEELAKEGLVSKEFARMGKNVHYSDWKLHVHQEQAIRKIVKEERNIVVSTGTGSGKTECYLYPILNSLMREKEAGTLGPGVRALLLFPMNALANDQQKKLRKLLKEYPDITFGRYTGETEHKGNKETVEQAEKRLHDEYENEHASDSEVALRKALKNELMCREKMTEEPPHILLTNYAMLEYLLVRPDTAPFFDTPAAGNWRFIVIDEAHTYKGANGTEIAFLLRRLKERIRHHMSDSFRCIATSATLGNEQGKKDLASFAENLFGEPFSESDVITTKRFHREKPDNGRFFKPEDYKKLKEASSGMSKSEKGLFLYQELLDDLRLFSVYEALENRPKRIEEVASNAFFDIQDEQTREKALIDLIELAAAAQKDETEAALLPARYHLFVKSLEGMFVQYYPSKSVFLDRRETVWIGGRSYSVFELSNCQKCEQEYLVGKIITKEGKDYLVQSNGFEKPEYFFVSNRDETNLDGFDEDDTYEESSKLSSLNKYQLCLCCGRITPFAEKRSGECCNGADSKIITVYNLKYSGKDSESNCCPCCGSTRKGLIKRFLTANQPATFAVAKSLYDAIPPQPQEEKKQKDIFDEDIFADEIFADETPNGAEKKSSMASDESGRKLLIFSDNRQEAAFFAGFFENKYNLLMWRKTLLQCLEEAPNHSLAIPDLIRRSMNLAEKNGLFSFDQERYAYLTDDQKREMAAHYVMQEFLHPEIQTKLEGLGFITIEPEEQTIKAEYECGGFQGKDLWSVLRYMMDSLRQKGAVSFPEEIRATDDFFAPRNHNAYFRKVGTKIEGNGHVLGFIPGEKAQNKRLGLVLKLDTSEASKEEKETNARRILEKIYELLLMLGDRKGYLIKTKDSSNGTAYCLNHAKWRFRLLTGKEHLYRCNKCKNVFAYSIRGLCPEMKCDGTLEEVEAEEIQKAPYYYHQFKDKKLIPMVAREHTAQLSSETAGKYQKSFEEGKINVLSCSTTFEMGVDVGELEATFLRNVPPETSNYIQRAGRAGRRTSSAAFSVTFSRRNSHDMTFFHDPAQIIAGKISSPVLEIGNEKIAERHLNSIIVAWFFKKHPEYFREDTKKIVSFEDEHNNMREVLRNDLETKPEDLRQSISSVFSEKVCSALKIQEWTFIDNLVGEEGSLTKAILLRRTDIDGLKKYSSELRREGGKVQLYQAIAAEKLISTLEEEPSLNFLSAKGVLPKYGFPIDSVTLDVISGEAIETKKIDLNRDLKMAISEFAPPAQIVANGRVWKSYAINTIPSKSWPTYVYYDCPGCKRIYPPTGGMVDINVNLDEIDPKKCDNCGTLTNPKKFIIPIFGFSTQMGDKPKMVGETRPSTYYSTQTQFWGIDDLTEKQKAEAKDKTLSICGKKLEITYSPGGKLFVLNQGLNRSGLCICPACGFATDTISGMKTKKHDTKFGKPCSNKLMVFSSLGHEFSTDILKIRLPEHHVDINLPEGMPGKNQTLSVLYAILEGASAALDISRGDIDGCVTGRNEIVLYDDTAGGSGFVKHIFSNFDEVIKEAREKVSGICGCTEETSCYGCLRNYSNQVFHDEISRGMAYRYLDWLINTEPEEIDPPKQDEDGNCDEEPLGQKKSNYVAPDTSCNEDTVTMLEDILKNSNDSGISIGAGSLLKLVRGQVLERPIRDDYIPVEENIWPEVFWGKSHVALFTHDNERQYQILKKYDWHCYYLDESINPHIVLSHIRKGE